jgi:transposase
MSDESIPAGISPADWQATPAAVRAVVGQLLQQNAVLQGQVKQLTERIAQLEERLNQNSHNSSKPPSTDPPQTPSRPPHPPSGRQAGGQPGHPGHNRPLKPLKAVAHVVLLRPLACAHCGTLLLGSDRTPERHQVSELPRIVPAVTEYQRHTLTCLHCGQTTSADWPHDMPAGDFGPRLQATVGYLSGRLSLSQRDIEEVCDTLLHIELSLGSVSAQEAVVSAAVAPAVAAVQTYVQQSAQTHVDETGWFEHAQHGWLWLAATPLVSLFLILPTRSKAGLQALLGAAYVGIVHSDRWSAYNVLDPSRRQLCWAHLLRDFQKLVERGGASQALGVGLLAAGQRLFALWDQLRAGTLSRVDFQTAVQPLRAQVHELLQAGVQLEQPQTRHLCQNLLKLEVALWTFVSVEGLEPTNNLAERGLRRAVLWRRRSFGTQSAAGSEFVARILTVVTSLRQQHRDVLDYLTAACEAAIRGDPPPSLLPSHTT